MLLFEEPSKRRDVLTIQHQSQQANFQTMKKGVLGRASEATAAEEHEFTKGRRNQKRENISDWRYIEAAEEKEEAGFNEKGTDISRGRKKRSSAPSNFLGTFSNHTTVTTSTSNGATFTSATSNQTDFEESRWRPCA